MRGAVIGSGPAGVYAAQALLRRYPTMHVDLLERLPVPFGLVRYGVSPDHPSTKNAISQFSSFIESNRDHISFYGNVSAGPGTPLDQDTLSQLYNLTVFATGAKAPRRLPHVEIPHQGVHSAHDFVKWINGHPEIEAGKRADIEKRISSGNDIAVIGLGNVAIDVARMLLRSTEDFADTDVSPRALDVLQNARIRTVSVVGRKNPARAAWTTAALREVVTKIPGIITECSHSLLQRDLESPDLPRTSKRALKLLLERTEDAGSAGSEKGVGERKTLYLQFLSSPQSFKLLPNGNIDMELTTRDEKLGDQSFIKGEHSCIFLSLGYCPDEGSGYRVGWANGKATGIIGDNKWDAESVVSQLPDLLANAKPGLHEWLRKSSAEAVTWEGWRRIDEEERHRGMLAGRATAKIKIESISEMLQVARGASPR